MQTKILVADDTSAIVDALQWMLEDLGYDVSTTSNGEEVMRLMADQHPDLVLLDVWMPGADGRKLCQQIKQQDSLKQIPVLLMSAHRDLQQMSAQAGADGYLEKPFTVNGLLSTISMAMPGQVQTDP